MKKIITIILVLTLMGSMMVSVSAATKLATNTNTVYSWVGLKCFSINVKGWYDSDGTKVTAFNPTTAQADTWGPWTSSQRNSFWLSTTNTREARCYGEAKFVLGLATDKFSIGVLSRTQGVGATGRP